MAKRILPDDQPFRTPRPLYGRFETPESALREYKRVYGLCDAKACPEDRVQGDSYCRRHQLVDAY